LFGFKMKGKGKAKSLIIILILVLVGVLAVFGLNTAKDMFSSAAGGAEPTGVKVEAQSNAATISWTSQKEVMAVLQYGTTPASLLLRALETNPSTTHQVAISPLKSATTYYFNIRVGDEVYDNGGIPYSFKTEAGGGGGEGVPEINLTGGAQKPSSTPVPSQAKPTSGDTEDKCSFLSEHYGESGPQYDYNGDGKVNVMDYTRCRECQEILGHLGSAEVKYDKNGDGKVNMTDYVECMSP
jgi:hypothetical protein